MKPERNLFVDWVASRKLYHADHSFYALLFATISRADPHNLHALMKAFPEIVKEAGMRSFAADGGALTPEERKAWEFIK